MKEQMSLEEQVRLYIKLMKEGRLPRDPDEIIDSYPRRPEKCRDDNKD